MRRPLATLASVAACLLGLGAAAQPAATSSDGLWRLAAAPPASLLLTNAAGAPVRSWLAASLDGRTTSEVAQVRDVPARRSFIVSFVALPELWEISYDPAAEPIFDGLVHDYRMGEGIARSGFLGARRTPLESPVTLLAVAAQGRVVLALAHSGAPVLEAIHLDVRRRIARLPLAFTPAPEASVVSTPDGREVLVLVDGQGRTQPVEIAAGGRQLLPLPALPQGDAPAPAPR